MDQLDKKYIDRLAEIEKAIQESDELALYLEEEEDEQFRALQETYEPLLAELHDQVAAENPLQLIAFERALTKPAFEGLFLPRILGYSVLRGEVTTDFKYARPQNHFKEILLTICHSSNFDVLKQRIGQSIQMGFALSSDIWITHLINSIEIKRVSQFLIAQKLDKYRDIRSRHTGYLKYKKQFSSFNYYTAEFPSTPTELKLEAPTIKRFLLHRAAGTFDNSSFKSKLYDFIKNSDLSASAEYVDLLMMIGMFYDIDGAHAGHFSDRWNALRQSYPDFENEVFNRLHDTIQRVPNYNGAADKRLSALIDKSGDDEISQYFMLMDTVHGKGYIHEDAIEAVRKYYYRHQGLSIENECVRAAIFSYFKQLMSHLDESAYTDYFEINKTFVQYMNIFSNEKFNQDVKGLSLAYVRRLLKRYTDKRGKDYQDIKKFVSSTFLDLGFMKEKEIAELFKTRRKKKAS